MPPRVRLADVARLAGLSSSTASSILNGRLVPPRVPEETVRRVREAAAELGYAPDPTARGLRTGRSGTIGFLSDEVTVTRFASAMIRGVLDASESREHVVLITECDQRAERMTRTVETLRSRRVEGLVIGLMRARRIESPPGLGRLPAIVANGTAPGLRAVLPDERRAGREAVEYLVAQGHREIAVIGRTPEAEDPAVSVTIARRFEGIDAAMAAAGLRFVHDVRGAVWEPPLGYDGTLETLDRAPGVTAVLAANDRVAFGVYQAAQARGLSIPDQLSVMSFDDEQLAAYLRPEVTTMRLPYLEMGRTATELLLDAVAADTRLEGEAEVLVPMPLVERGSVRRLSPPSER